MGETRDLGNALAVADETPAAGRTPVGSAAGQTGARATVQVAETAGMLCDFRPGTGMRGSDEPNCGVFAEWLLWPADGAFASVAACDQHLPRAARTATS